MSRVVRRVLPACLALLLALVSWPALATGHVELTLTGPAEVEPEADITVSGTLTVDGSPVHNADVELSWKCADPWQPDWTSHRTVRTHQGGFAVTTTAQACSRYVYEAVYRESASQNWTAEHSVSVARTTPTLLLSAPGTAVPGDEVPVTLSLTTPDGEPIAGGEVKVVFEHEGGELVVDNVVTGADGAAQVVQTPLLEGRYDHRASVAGTATMAGVPSNNDQTAVSKLPSSLTLEGPDSAVLDEMITLSGALTGPESPQDLVLTEPDGSTRTVTTEADGTYEVMVPASIGGQVRWRMRYPGSLRYAAAGAVHDVTVPKIVTELTTSGPATVRLDESFTITGRLHGVDAPAEVEVTRPNGLSETFTTEADGSFAVETGTTLEQYPGTKTWTFDYPGDPRHAASTRAHEVEVLPIATALTLDGPQTAPLDKPITLAGRLTGVSGSQRVTVTDPLGYPRTIQTATDGTFTFQTSPQWVSGPATWKVWYDGDNQFASAMAERTVYIEPLQPTIEVRADRSSYTAGQGALITVTLEGSESEIVVVTARRESRKAVELFRGYYPEGGLTLTRETRHSERIKAVSPRSDRELRAVGAVDLGVRLRLRTQPLDPVRMSGRYAIYRTSADPLIESVSEPQRPGTCLRHQVQRLRDGVWRPVTTSTCEEQNRYGKVRWRLAGTQPAGVKYRVRAFFAGDPVNLASRGPWAYYSFRP